MSMPASLPAVLLGLVLTALACLPAPALGSGQAGYATVRAGSLYVGGERAKKAEKPPQPVGEKQGVSMRQADSEKQAESPKQAGSRVELRLLDNNFFVLRQVSAVAGKEPVIRDMTGNWRQVEGGSMLRLTNRHGLDLGLNIGAKGNLYGDFFPLPGEKTPSFILKLAPPRDHSFFIMGTLERGPTRISLTDSASGRVFSPVSGEALARLPEQNPLFVDAEVSPSGKGLRIERFRSFSSRFPQYTPAAPTLQDFAGDVEAHAWMLPPMKGLKLASCTFTSGGKGRGLLEVTGQGLRLTADYTLDGGKMQFLVTAQDEDALRAAGAQALPHMLKAVRAWAMEAGALVLTDAEGQSVVLEKATGRERR